MECPPTWSASLRLDVGGSDHLGPFFGVFADEFTEAGGGAWKSSPSRSELPLATDAISMIPGVAWASAMNSGTDAAGTEGWTSITFRTRRIPAIAALSRMKLKFSLSNNVALIALGGAATSSVYPSAGAR